MNTAISTPSSFVEGHFEPTTGTVSYIVTDPVTKECAVIDSVLDFDPRSGRTRTASADRLIARVEELGLHVTWLLETHVHADHLSAAPYLQARLGGRLGIGAHIVTVQRMFGDLFNVEAEFARDGSQFDHLFKDGDVFSIGNLRARAMYTPGHTPACLTYVIEDATQTIAFVGDTLFMPDYGTARCDFPGGDARKLFHSINKVLDLPAHTTIYTCHDYQPGGREVRFMSTVAQQRASNVHLCNGVTEDEFVAMRSARDAKLDMPVLMIPSVQVNMRAGHLPAPESNGVQFLKIPLNAL